MKLKLIIVTICIAAAAQAAPITLTIIASDGTSTYTNKVTILDKYVPQDLNTLADQQGVKPRNNVVRRAGALARRTIMELMNKGLLPIFNERKRAEAVSAAVEETTAATSEGDE